MYEVIFLWVFALIYIIFAVVQDIRTKEIANWINFSLIIFAIGFRFFYSLFQGDGFVFFYNGLIGLAIFFVAGNLLYYGKVFAGGDAKLMISLGAILPYSSSIISNLESFFNFILIFLFVGFLYIFASSAFFCIKNFKSFKKEFLRQLKKNKKLMIIALFISILLLAFGFFQKLSIILGVLIFITSYLYLYSKAIDESCMVKRIKISDLKEGDWLYSNVKIGKKVINAKWEGVSKKDIREIAKKYRHVKIRQGIAFSPVFLISFVVFILLVLFRMNLWDPFW
jgi:Flp pilus assembly protein protease CpaA